MVAQPIQVMCYAGSRSAERPVAVILEGQRCAVREVVRTWRTPAGPGFLVILEDGRSLRLALNEAIDQWSLLESS